MASSVFELNVYLHSGEEAKKEEEKEELDETTNGAAEETPPPSKNKAAEFLKKTGKLLAAVNVVGQLDSKVLHPLANFGVNAIGNIYGDTARMNQINNFTSSINTGMGFVRSGLRGYSVGKISGGKGAGVALAIVNIVMDVAGEAVKMIENAVKYNNQQLDYKYNSMYSQERLGSLAINKGR